MQVKRKSIVPCLLFLFTTLSVFVNVCYLQTEASSIHVVEKTLFLYSYVTYHTDSKIDSHLHLPCFLSEL